MSPAQTTDDGPASSQGVLTAARDGGILFLGSLFEYASRFVFGIIVARALGADGFGSYTLALAVATLLGGIAVLGLDAGMVRFLPPSLHQRNEARVWGTLQVGLALSAITGAAFGVALFGLSDIIAANLFHDPAVAPILRWISLVIPALAIGRVLRGAIRGFKQMRYQVYADSILFNLSKIGLTVALLALGMGFSGTLAAYAIALLLADGLLFYFLNHLFSLRRPLRDAQRDARKILSFSGPICLTLAVRRLGGSLEVFLLGLVGTVAAVGVFGAAVRVCSIGTMFMVATGLATRPIISDLHHRGEMAQLGQIYKTLTRWSFALMLPYFVTVVLFAEPMLAIFGEEFEAGVPALLILSIGTLVSAATGICSAMIIMTDHSKLALLNTLAGVALTVALSLSLIPVWGLIGAAVATTLSITAVNIMRLFQVRWLLKFWPYNQEFVKPIAASLVALGFGLFVRRLVPAERSLLYLMLDVAILWSAYIATILLLGLTAEDRMVLSHTRRRFGAALNWR